jgi:hypothetical protein
VEAALEIYNVCLFVKNFFFENESIKIKEIAVSPVPCAFQKMSVLKRSIW